MLRLSFFLILIPYENKEILYLIFFDPLRPVTGYKSYEAMSYMIPYQTWTQKHHDTVSSILSIFLLFKIPGNLPTYNM
jgi:hypothetical protein